MRQKLESLLELQKVELEIDRLNAALDSVSGKLEALDAKRALLQDTYDNEVLSMDLLKKKYRALESDAQANVSRVAKSQEKLGAVKTNKEYQALLKEIEDIQDKNSVIEDEMINSLEQMESTEIELAEKGKVLRQLVAQVTSEKEAILREAGDNKKKLEDAERQHMLIFKGVDTALMSDYLRVKKLVKSRVIVPVRQAICQGCNLNIPPQMFNELQRSDQLKFCPHCDRIIVWNDMLD